MEVTVAAAGVGDRAVLRRLLELYQHDFSEFDGRDVDQHGEFGYRYLDHYWTEPDRHAFLFKVDGHWAGFAMVRAGTISDMAEFFVMRKYRGTGVGRRAACDIFTSFGGRWTVRQVRTNASATAFWRTVIPVPYDEHESGDEIVQEFDLGA